MPPPLKSFLSNPENRKQFLTFAAVGASGTLVHYAVLFVCVEFAEIDPVTGTSIGALAGALVNYLLNYYITFKATSKHLATVGKFFAIAIAGMCANAMLVHFFVNIVKLHYIPSQLITTAIVLIITYAGNRLWTFSQKS
ncbi:GtrA family protein [Puniceicoccaceae bacterium K14]|nr:GtrA family protein [Puniceicoccaceae bacterium K14]